MSEENKTLIYTELQSGTVGGYVTDYSQIKNAPTINLSNYYTKSEIDNTIGNINNILESIINT